VRFVGTSALLAAGLLFLIAPVVDYIARRLSDPKA
jgi:hypothetical protein